MIVTKTGLCVSGENNWKFNFRWKLSRWISLSRWIITDGWFGTFLWPTGSAPQFVSIPMPAKATSFSLMMNSWQNCSLWAMLSCLLFSCEQGCEMHKNPALWCSSHFTGKERAFTESAGCEVEAWVQPKQEVLGRKSWAQWQYCNPRLCSSPKCLHWIQGLITEQIMSDPNLHGLH